MTETTSPALRTALAYHQAWTSQNLDQAMTYIADDIICDAPGARTPGPSSTGASSAGSCSLTGGDRAPPSATTPPPLFSTTPQPQPERPTAECFAVADGKITCSRFIFDRAPFDAARAAATQAGNTRSRIPVEDRIEARGWPWQR